jgi:hypothetical protein
MNTKRHATISADAQTDTAAVTIPREAAVVRDVTSAVVLSVPIVVANVAVEISFLAVNEVKSE